MERIPKFKLPFEGGKIKEYSDDYLRDLSNKDRTEEEELMKIAPNARIKRHCLSKDEFVRICDWKSKRPHNRREKNTLDLIKEVTEIAFCKNCDEKLRILVLTILDGVGIRTASAILHLAFHNDPNGYPLMDVRALRALTDKKYKENAYTSDLWKEYTDFCREKATRFGVTLRTLDRALWQWDKENNGEVA